MPISDLLSASGALLLVVGLIFLLRHGARFLQQRRPDGVGARISVQAQLGLDNKRRLQLVQCDGHQLLVLTGGAGDQMIAWPPTATAPATAGGCR